MTPEPVQQVAPLPKRRRTDQKSKKGCSACKTRHTKCDEGRPRCINCITTHRRCSSPAAPANAAAVASRATVAGTGSPCTPEEAAGALFTTSHLVCLHHAETQMERYTALHGTAPPIVDLAIPCSCTQCPQPRDATNSLTVCRGYAR
ncbi:hypothetical protein C7974DRAFT_393522 [Boeremia exigua]|uniref:uncharacterized protein n=1 Tax=Boeremia exigua TaxID=749465 RepID=UPI001E8DCEAB|nr:uncharacterized protein C7974DRAFT_393522 [Boeremia exigua]KAH6628956.1 hypothetical protein C7974DRAFT_393522 [Boeremia exigua]